jgi:protein TonB
MSHALFGTSLVASRSQARRALPASLALHAAALGVAVWASVLAGDPLPPVATTTPCVLGWPRPPAGSPGVVAVVRVPATRAARPPRVAPPFTAPLSVPDAPPRVDDLTETLPGDGAACAGCVVGAPEGDGEWGTAEGDGTGTPGPPAEAPREPLRVSEGVQAPAKLRHVPPQYPELARRAGVQGTVQIECVIDPQGNVVRARVVRGVALLDAAALEAVQQWRYAPSRLNGVPVAVIMTVSVQFHLR